MITCNKVNEKNIFSEKLFNKIPDENKNISWRNLSSENRFLIIKEYFTLNFKTIFDKDNKCISHTDNIEEKTIYEILNIVNSGKLRLKKEVVYDSVNKQVINIKALLYNKKKGLYIYDPSILVKKKNSSKIAKNILFRKK